LDGVREQGEVQDIGELTREALANRKRARGRRRRQARTATGGLTKLTEIPVADAVGGDGLAG
jgi:hypothetical protein